MTASLRSNMGLRRSARQAHKLRNRKKSVTAQRVFNTPELVGQIVDYMVQDAPITIYGCKNVHQKCRSIWQYMMLNRVWHAEVSRLVWRCLSFFRVDELFLKIPSESRQQYANHVRTAAMDSFSDVGGLTARSVLSGVRFPNLSRLDIFFVSHRASSRIRFNRGNRLPEIDGESVTKLNLANENSGDIYELPESWLAFSRQIHTRFPNLQEVTIRGNLTVPSNVMKQLSRRYSVTAIELYQGNR